MIRFDITKRSSEKTVLFSAKLDLPEDTYRGYLLGETVRAAINERVSLRGANLARAYMRGFDLHDGYFAEADLTEACLAGANLGDANFSNADMRGATLQGAYLSMAVLRGVNLRGADLRSTYFSGAVLTDADFTGAQLEGIYFGGASLDGARRAEGVSMSKPPIMVSGLDAVVLIFDRHMEIGGELHALSEWQRFDEHRIAEMRGSLSYYFWEDHKELLLSLARANGRSD